MTNTYQRTTQRRYLVQPDGATITTAPAEPMYFGAIRGDTTALYLSLGAAWSGASALAEWTAERDAATVVVETVETVTMPEPRTAPEPSRLIGPPTPVHLAPFPVRHSDTTAVYCSDQSDTPDAFHGAATLRFCTVPRRNGAPCGREYRPIWKDSGAGAREYACPKHGAVSAEWRYSETDAAPIGMVDHVTWCESCEWTASRIVAADAGYRADCPEHGADSTRGADLPRVTDLDLAPTAGIERKYQDAGWIAPRPGAATEWAPLGRTRGTGFADTNRGESIRFGAERGRKGKQVRGESRGWVMASGDYRTRTTAPTPDGSAVVLRRTTGALPSGAVPITAPTAVVSKDGAPLETISATARRSLTARDARIGAVLDRQVSESAPARSRRASVAGRAPRPAARKTDAAKAATAVARAERRNATKRAARAVK
jgi:hypothetical protein